MIAWVAYLAWLLLILIVARGAFGPSPAQIGRDIDQWHRDYDERKAAEASGGAVAKANPSREGGGGAS